MLHSFRNAGHLYPIAKGVQGGEIVHENWTPPINSFSKLNVDAACNAKDGKVAVGAVVRDSEGKLQGALMHPISGNLTPHATEALAVLYGMKFCLMSGFKKLEIESDAANVISAILNQEVDLSMEGSVFEEIKFLKQAFEEVIWRKIPRSCNRAAHSVARKALNDSFWKEVGPPWLNEIVIEELSMAQ